MNKRIQSFTSLSVASALALSSFGSAAFARAQGVGPGPAASAALAQSGNVGVGSTQPVVAAEGQEAHLAAVRGLYNQAISEGRRFGSSVGDLAAEVTGKPRSIDERRQQLIAVQNELRSLNFQLTMSVAANDISLALGVSSVAFGVLGGLGRLGAEGVERGAGWATMKAAAVLPRADLIQAAGGKTVGVIDRLGKIGGKIVLVGFLVGSATSVIVYYATAEQIPRLVKELNSAIERIDRQVAEIDYVVTGVRN